MLVAEAWRADFLLWAIPVLILLGTIVVLAVIVVVFLIRLYAQLTCGIYHGKTRMDGKTVIVTGCTRGIGKETARDLAKRGARVIMACRNLEVAEKVRDEIVKETNNEKVVAKKLDLASLASIRAFAEDINKTEAKLDVLIHNAGYAQSFKKVKTEDGNGD